MKLKKRHIIIGFILRPLVALYCRIKYNLHIKRFKPKAGYNGPYIIIGNHNCNLDPVFVSLCFSFPVFFVASDHIFRLGFVSRLLEYLFSPIPKLKTASDVHTIKDIMSALRSGASVGVFPEGNRSWNGETEEMSPAIGKLIHRLSVPLIICRIHGGYLSTPRWSGGTRRGRIDCSVAREVSQEEISAMSVDELNKLITSELYVNAFEDQKENNIKYKGKDPAENIETVLYTCPNCGGFSTIVSKKNKARCGCGLEFYYEQAGFLRGAPFCSVLEWDKWQEGRLKELLEQKSEAKIFSDAALSLFSVERAKDARLLCEGDLYLYRDRLVFKAGESEQVFFLSDITSVVAWGRMVLQFSVLGTKHYEIKAPRPISLYKYIRAYKILKAPT